MTFPRIPPGGGGPPGAGRPPGVDRLPDAVGPMATDRPFETILERVRARGFLRCGVNGAAHGFSYGRRDAITDVWHGTGMEIDLARAIAAAVIGDERAVEFVPQNELLNPASFLAVSPRILSVLFPTGTPSGAELSFQMLRDGDLDIVMATKTNFLRRDASITRQGEGLDFGPTYFHDGLGFLVDSAEINGIDHDSTLADLPNNTCVFGDFWALQRVAAVASGLQPAKALQLVPADDGEDVETAFLTKGDCHVLTRDRSRLAGFKKEQEEANNPDAANWLVLKQTISKEPLAPVVRHGDAEWAAIVRWCVYATFLAEEKGVTKDNIEEKAPSGDDYEVSLAFGNEGMVGTFLGLDLSWAYRAVFTMGNYGEIYERAFEDLDLPRDGTLNASYLANPSGLIHAPPIR